MSVTNAAQSCGCARISLRSWGQRFLAEGRDGIAAAMTVEGAVDRCVFDTFVNQVLAPSLRPGQVVIWDDLGVHKSAAAEQRITACGCQLLWVPPSSPDFNPIELAFDQLNAALRRTAGAPAKPRTRQSRLHPR